MSSDSAIGFRSILRVVFLTLMCVGDPATGSPPEQKLLSIQLAPRPFSPALCQTTGHNKAIRIQAAKYRDLILRRVPGQFIPEESREARVKDYVYFVRLPDLTDGVVSQGIIAFDREHAVISTPDYPQGLSRRNFIDTLPESQQQIAEAALNTFLRLQPAFNAAIDTCRAYPPFVVYGTDDEIDRIEAARQTFAKRVQQFNTDPKASSGFALPESGISDGFVDPDAGRGTNVSYQALNPLNFYVPSEYP
jgi:hypothetical protein